MDNSLLMSGGQSAEQLRAQHDGFALRYRAVGEQFVKAHSGNQFDDQKIPLLERIELEDCFYIGMADARERQGLIAHAMTSQRTANGAGREYLDGNVAFQPLVARAIHHAHSPHTNLLEHAIAPKHAAGLNKWRWSRHGGNVSANRRRDVSYKQ